MTATRLTAIAIIILITVLLIVSCSPSQGTASAVSVKQEEPDISKTEQPVLSDSLIRNCQREPRSSSVRTGNTAVDFTLKDTQGLEFNLASLLTEKPVLIIFGSFT